MLWITYFKRRPFDRLIGKTAACRHREASKQIEASFPKTDPAHGEIYDHVGNNSAYQELGELSKPTVYETLGWQIIEFLIVYTF